MRVGSRGIDVPLVGLSFDGIAGPLPFTGEARVVFPCVEATVCRFWAILQDWSARATQPGSCPSSPRAESSKPCPPN